MKDETTLNQHSPHFWNLALCRFMTCPGICNRVYLFWQTLAQFYNDITYFPLLYPHLNNSFLVSTLKVIKSHKRLYLRDVQYYSDFPSIIFFLFLFLLLTSLCLFSCFLLSLPVLFLPPFLSEFHKY